MAKDPIPPAEDAGSSGGKILLLVGLVLGVIGGAGGGYIFFQSAEKVLDNGEQEVVVETKPEVPEQLINLDFDRINVPVYVSRDGRRRYLGNYFVDLRFQFTNEEKKVQVDRQKDRLRHNLLSAISNADLSVEGSDGQIDLDHLREVLIARSESVVGNDMIYDIVILQAVRLNH